MQPQNDFMAAIEHGNYYLPRDCAASLSMEKRSVKKN